MAATLLALRRSAEQWLPLTPSRGMTLESLKRLRDGGFLELPWPELTWIAPSDGLQLPVEQLGFRYTWGSYRWVDLEHALADRLSEVGWLEDGPAERVRLWEELSIAETESFLERQLEQHGFDPKWASDLNWVRAKVPVMSLAKWRYIVWAAVRKGAAEFARGGITPERSRRTIHQELTLRAEKVSSGAYGGVELPPRNFEPFSLLGRICAELILPLGMEYWISTPLGWAQRNAV